MNIYYFDPSLNCALFFISLSLYPITLYLSLAFSIFTHYPLTHFLVLPHSFLFPSAFIFYLLILPSISFHLFHPSLTFSLCYPPMLPSPSPHCSVSHPQLKPDIIPQSWSWDACTQNGPRSKVLVGNTRIRVIGCPC